jgi:hypothetical protein
MRFVTAALTAAALAVSAGSAMAAPAHLNDSQFLAANRCLGLATSRSLAAPQDAAALRKLVHDQSFGRVGFVYDRGDELRDDAMHDADRAGGDLRVRLTAERDGLCHSLVAMTSTTAAASQGTPSSLR